MKKITLAFTILLTILLFVGCNNTTPVEFNDEEMEKVAKDTINSLVNGDYKAVSDNFSQAVASQLSVEQLEEAWIESTKDLGVYETNHSYSYDILDNLYVCSLKEDFSDGELTITLSFNADKQIEGIFFNPQPNSTPETNDTFTETSLQVGSEQSMPLNGILTIPNEEINPPVVILVQGSGAQNKDSAIGSLTPFKDIAHALAQKGIASYRFDQRFYTYPESVVEYGSDVTLREETIDDVNSAIEVISKDKRVDNNKMFVLGHSLGGMLTPVIATENDNLSGIISMSGSLRPLYEISYDQNMAIKATLSDEELEEHQAEYDQIDKDIEILRGDLTRVSNDTMLLGLPAGYQKSVKEYAGENFIDEVDIPIMVLQGSDDFQVSVDKDYKSFETALEGNEKATLKLYDGLNHMMVKSNGLTDITEYNINGTVDTQVTDDIAEFILNN